MPYIKQWDRAVLNSSTREPQTVGELNYMITKLVDEFITRNGKNYATMNEAMGALECAKLELYRRIVSPYEDAKIIENGDVYKNV